MDSSTLTAICTIIAAQFLALLKFISDVKKLKKDLASERNLRSQFEKESLERYKESFHKVQEDYKTTLENVFTPYITQIAEIKNELQELTQKICNNAELYKDLTQEVTLLATRVNDMFSIMENSVSLANNTKKIRKN